MKNLFALLPLWLYISSISAQIAPRKIDADNIVSVLNAKGYEIHSYDLTALLDKDYQISVFVESSDSTDRRSFTVDMGLNRRSVDLLPPEEKAKYLKRKPKDKRFFMKAEQLSIYIIPHNDSIKTLMISIPNVKNYSCRIKLNGQNNGKTTAYIYRCVSMDLGRLELNKRTPLLFYGSYWWDAKANLFKFCGLPDIETGVTSCDLAVVPHYYLIGIEVKEVESKPKTKP